MYTNNQYSEVVPSFQLLLSFSYISFYFNNVCYSFFFLIFFFFFFCILFSNFSLPSVIRQSWFFSFSFDLNAEHNKVFPNICLIIKNMLQEPNWMTKEYDNEERKKNCREGKDITAKFSQCVRSSNAGNFSRKKLFKRNAKIHTASEKAQHYPV